MRDMECCLPLPAGLAPPSWRGRPRQTVPHPTKSVAAAISVELLDGRRACFETPASRAPQHEVFLCVTRSLPHRSEEHTSELQSLMRISYAVYCLKKKTNNK